MQSRCINVVRKLFCPNLPLKRQFTQYPIWWVASIYLSRMASIYLFRVVQVTFEWWLHWLLHQILFLGIPVTDVMMCICYTRLVRKKMFRAAQSVVSSELNTPKSTEIGKLIPENLSRCLYYYQFPRYHDVRYDHYWNWSSTTKRHCSIPALPALHLESL